MLYYRVKKQYDGTPVYRLDGRSNNLTVYRYLIANELYTKTELKHLFFESKAGRVMGGNRVLSMFDELNLKKSQVYTSFGARFEGARFQGEDLL